MVRGMGLPIPPTLSPSSMGCFTSCPLAFKFSYVERLPEPPSAPASKGTLVHLALQHLMWRPAPERTIDAALADLTRATRELETDAEFTGLQLSPEEWEQFRADAEVLMRRYFELEDPTRVRVLGVELKLAAKLERATLRGIIDRLELDDDGELVITDYKTGNTPSERWEQKSLAGVHVYSLMCEQVFGRRPARVQLLYLSKPEAIIATPSDVSLRGVSQRSGAVMAAVQRACSHDDFRPKTSALCNFCNFQEFCPAFGGDPSRAAVVMNGARRDGRGPPAAPPRRLMPGAIARFDAAVEGAVERMRNPTLDQVFYALSAAADHSKLWHGVAWVRGAATGRPDVARRMSSALAIESFVTNVVVKGAFGRVRPYRPEPDGPLPYNMRVPITSSFPSGHATAAFTAAVFLSDDDAFTPLWFTLASAVAFSRVYVRMHHASDVVAGAALGLGLGVVLRRILLRR